MSLNYEPSSEPLHISAKQLFLNWEAGPLHGLAVEAEDVDGPPPELSRPRRLQTGDESFRQDLVTF